MSMNIELVTTANYYKYKVIIGVRLFAECTSLDDAKLIYDAVKHLNGPVVIHGNCIIDGPNTVEYSKCSILITKEAGPRFALGITDDDEDRVALLVNALTNPLGELFIHGGSYVLATEEKE